MVCGAMLGPHTWAVCRWRGLKWSWLSEQAFLHLSRAREGPSVPKCCASNEKTNTITSRNATIMASEVWWLLARARFPGATMGGTGKVCNPRVWSKTPTLQASLNRSAIKHDFISLSSPLLPRLMKLHLNWGIWVAHPAASLMWQGGSGMHVGNGNGKMVLPSKPMSMGQMGRVTVSLYSAAMYSLY